jgi:GH25 family lysozyme M1 (1,4-beta-N-acetylmuramidase)
VESSTLSSVEEDELLSSVEEDEPLSSVEEDESLSSVEEDESLSSVEEDVSPPPQATVNDETRNNARTKVINFLKTTSINYAYSNTIQ